jgi:hypothetical protein
MGEALRHCADLKSVFRRHAGGWLDRESLGRVKELCARTSIRTAARAPISRGSGSCSASSQSKTVFTQPRRRPRKLG